MLAEAVLGSFAVLSALGIILVKKPVYAGLSFLLTLLMLSGLYLQLSAGFIAAMQILVYAGAILVIFMFVIILFQDAHAQIEKFKAGTSRVLVGVSALLFVLSIGFIAQQMVLPQKSEAVSDTFGTVQSLGSALFTDYFFPFEAVTPLFLVAIVGAVYLGKRE